MRDLHGPCKTCPTHCAAPIGTKTARQKAIPLDGFEEAISSFPCSQQELFVMSKSIGFDNSAQRITKRVCQGLAGIRYTTFFEPPILLLPLQCPANIGQCCFRIRPARVDASCLQ